MWVATRVGFFSIVQKKGEEGLTIRARARKDLQQLKARYLPDLSDIQEGGGTDYQYRAWCSHQQWADASSRIALDIDYANFKSQIKKEVGPTRSGIYSQVWGALWDIYDQDDD